MRMTFGKYKYAEISSLPDDYLHWVAEQPWIKQILREELQREIYRREDGPADITPTVGMIEKARRQLALKHHPDVGGKPGVMVGINLLASYLIQELR